MKLKMKAKIASIHNKISITDEEGSLVYQVHSKVFSLHNVTYLTDGEGEEIAVITRKPVSMHDVRSIPFRRLCRLSSTGGGRGKDRIG